MTPDACSEAIARLGYTPRQARFLTLVLRHSGVCLGRQYCAFAGIAYGQQMHDFFQALVIRRHATAHPCPDRRGRLFHLHAQRLYRAIGEPNHPYRRRGSLGRAVERLMLLDAVLIEPQTTWFGGSADHGEQPAAGGLVTDPSVTLPPAFVAETRRDVTARSPMGLRPTDQTTVFLYLVAMPDPRLFRAFLRRHRARLQALPRWSIELVIPAHLAHAEAAYRSTFDDELTPPDATAIDDLQWYFVQGRNRSIARSVEPRPHYNRAHRTFAAPRFQGLYRAWCARGDAVLDQLKSVALADAIARGDGRLEHRILAPRYHGLEHLVGTA